MTSFAPQSTNSNTVTTRLIGKFLAELAPTELAEAWDNVGLLVGHADAPIQRVMTCLTITPIAVAEAIRTQANLIVTHHPLPFRAVQRITDESVVGRMLLDLIHHRIAVYSPHTAFDSARAGINQRLANLLELQQVVPLRPASNGTTEVGAGRFGKHLPPVRLEYVVSLLKSALQVTSVQFVGDRMAQFDTIGVACGSAGEFLGIARQQGCQLFITGETNFHTCLEAEATGVGLLLLGHFASERFAVVELADVLQATFPSLEIWACRDEVDPIKTV